MLKLVGIVCKTPTMTCPENYWLCKTSQECIPFNFICDHVPDCGDQSDEDPIICNVCAIILNNFYFLETLYMLLNFRLQFKHVW